MATTGGVSSSGGRRNRRSKFEWPVEGSFDPDILNEVAAGRRGLQQLLWEIKQADKRARKDKRVLNRELKQDRDRAYEDLATRLQRGNQDLDSQRSKSRLQSSRNQADFGRRLSDLAKESARTGVAQTERANVRGVSGGGSLAASAAIRRRNLDEAQDPVELEMERDIEDLGRTLGTLDVAGERLQEDRDRDAGQLRQDYRSGRRAIRQDYRRGKRDRRKQGEFARQEQRRFRRDRHKAAWYYAQQNHPEMI